MTKEQVLLTDAAAEIKMLRRQNEILGAKVEMIDFFAMVLHTKPAERTECASPDVVWQIERYLSEVKEDKPA